MKKFTVLSALVLLGALCCYSQTVVTQFKPGSSIHALAGASTDGPLFYAGASRINFKKVFFSLQAKADYFNDYNEFAPNVGFTVGYMHSNDRRPSFCYPNSCKFYLLPTATLGYGKFIEKFAITRSTGLEESEEVFYNAPYFGLGYCLGVNHRTFHAGISADISVLYRKAESLNTNYTGLNTHMGLALQSAVNINKDFVFQTMLGYKFQSSVSNRHYAFMTVGLSYNIQSWKQPR